MGSDLKGLLDKLKSKEGTQEDAYNFLVKVGAIRPKERTLEGQEKEEMMLILKLLTPYESSNNQRFWTDEYVYGDNRYSVTYFDENEYEVTEIKP
jgi:hypothetical protein